MVEESGEYHGGKGPRAPEQIEELFAAVAGERAAITRLTGCVADLNAAQAAKRAILSAVEVREARAQRRNSLRGAQ